MRLGALDFAGSDSEQSLIRVVFPQRMRREDVPRRLRNAADSVLMDTGRDSTSAPDGPIRAVADRFFAMTGDLLPTILGTEPTQDLFRDVAYSVTNVVLQLAGHGPLSIHDFAVVYTKMYPHG